MLHILLVFLKFYCSTIATCDLLIFYNINYFVSLVESYTFSSIRFSIMDFQRDQVANKVPICLQIFCNCCLTFDFLFSAYGGHDMVSTT